MSGIRCLLDGSIWKYVPPAAGEHNMEKVTGSMSEHVAVASVSPNAEFSGTVRSVAKFAIVGMSFMSIEGKIMKIMKHVFTAEIEYSKHDNTEHSTVENIQAIFKII